MGILVVLIPAGEVLWTGGHLAGAALLVGGLLVLTGVGGRRLGVRAGRRRDR